MQRPPNTATDTATCNVVHELNFEDRWISTKKKNEILDIFRERVGYIITTILDMRKLPAKWMPRFWNSDQRKERVQTSKTILVIFKTEQDFLAGLVTKDETRISIYDSENKEQSKEWQNSGIPRPKKFRNRNRPKRSFMASVF